MYAISTAVCVSVLALVSSLAVVVQATGPRLLCTETYSVLKGETCNTLVEKLAANQTVILSLNPGISLNDAPFSRQISTKGNGPLPNKVLCTKGYRPSCTLNATATDTTCNNLASKWNITQQDFVNYNDNVNGECTNLLVQQTYCVSIDGCYPGNTNAVCEQ